MTVTIEQLQAARGEALIALCKEVDADATSDIQAILIDFVKDSSQAEVVREEAAIALGRCKTPSSCSQLLQLLTAEDPIIRQFAAEGLREDDTDDSILWLIDALQDSVNKVRNVAERALLKRETQMAKVGVEQLLDLLNHPVPLTRSPAARLLGCTKDPRAREPLIEQLTSTEWLVRMWAAKGLGDLGDQQALPRLLEVMHSDEKNRVRAAAVEAVAALKPENADEILQEILATDSDEGVQKVANEALLALGFAGEELEYDPFADE